MKDETKNSTSMMLEAAHKKRPAIKADLLMSYWTIASVRLFIINKIIQ